MPRTTVWKRANHRETPEASRANEAFPIGFAPTFAFRFSSAVAMLVLALGLARSATAGDIYGTVTNPAGAPVDQATVEVRVGDETEEARTDANGRYRIRIESVGVGYIRARSQGFRLDWQRVHSSSRSVLMDLALQPNSN